MPGTNQEAQDKEATDWNAEQRREFRKAILEECIDHLDECGYFGASRILRRDKLTEKE